jgi:hypothetical protein
MSYWVYENWRAEDKAVIHDGTCSYCNNGKGCHPNPLGDSNGQWRGPFRTVAEAESAAKATGRRVQKKHACVRSLA